jgi:hypothetical protein
MVALIDQHDLQIRFPRQALDGVQPGEATTHDEHDLAAGGAGGVDDTHRCDPIAAASNQRWLA